MTWVVVAAGLLLLVFLHELGHFSVALLVGVRPRSFYVGFPPALFKFKRKGIEYGIGAIPLGGMVRIPGMNRPAGRDIETYMSPAVREDAELLPIVQRVRRAIDAEDFAAARAALPELESAIERVARRTAPCASSKKAPAATHTGGRRPGGASRSSPPVQPPISSSPFFSSSSSSRPAGRRTSRRRGSTASWRAVPLLLPVYVPATASSRSTVKRRRPSTRCRSGSGAATVPRSRSRCAAAIAR
jgi:membrane-associated protease RseP (regulator of RpoE activity)